jgi:hypothetical protein
MTLACAFLTDGPVAAHFGGGAPAGGGGGCDITAATASASDVQTAIDAATNGQRVCLPASSSATWSSAVSLGSGKYITLDLNGSTITLSGASGTFTINPHASGLNRITNGSIIKSGSAYTDYNGPFQIRDTLSGYGVRVDHIAFSGTGLGSLADGTLVSVNGQGAGVMDRCTFIGMGWADEFIHVDGWGPGDTTGWTTSANGSLDGSGSIFYFEDCTFQSAAAQAGVSWIEGFYGARLCIRYSTFNNCSWDMHGTAGNVGARWWECYHNVSKDTVTGGGGSMHYLCSFRAGSGVIWSNTIVSPGRGDIGLCEEDSGWPADYQIGRGQSQTSDPAYVWSNDGAFNVDDCDAPEVAGMVQIGRDVFASAKSGYTPYTYPHPFAT